MIRLVAVLTVFLPTFIFAQNTWSLKDTVNGAPRSVSSAFVMNGEAYIVAGLDEAGFRRKMYSYSYVQDDWDQEESIGGINGAGLNRGSACAFSIGLKAYVCLGQGETSPFLKDTWEYDLVTQTWSQKADFQGSARRQAISFVLGSLAYVGTGISVDGLEKDMYSYNSSTNTWTQKNDFGGTARKEAAAFSMGGQAYVGTGDDGVMRNDFWQYQVATDTWVQKANLPGLARKGAVGWGIFPNAYICAGEDINFTYSNELWEYNYFLNSWTQRASLPGPGRSNAMAFVLNGLGFVGTGYNGVFLNDLFAYTPILGNEEIVASSDVNVYPTPAKESVNIQIESNDTEIELFTLTGQHLNSNKYCLKTTSGFIVHREDLPSGQYLFNLKNQDGTYLHSGKIIFD